MRVLTVLLVLPIVLLAGCQGTEQQTPSPVETARSHEKKIMTLAVPDAVKSRWKAVRICVTDKAAVKKIVHTIPIGGKINLPASSMTIEVEAFLPTFVMEGSVMTSSSNELKNPGAKVKIREGSNLVFDGWLFSRFPNTHAFMHPRYGFALVDVVPVR